MKPRFRSAWLEIGAGFHLLFAGVAASELAEAPAPFGADWLTSDTVTTVMLLAACAVFLLHATRALPRVRRYLLLSAGVAAAAASAWFFSQGEFGIAALQTGYAAWLLAAAAVPGYDGRIMVTKVAYADGFRIFAGAALAVLGVRELAVGGPWPWYGLPLAVASVLIGAAFAVVEARGMQRPRLLVSTLAALALLPYAATAFGAGEFGSFGALMTLFSLVLLSTALDPRLPEGADDMGGVTPRQREIFAYERAGEVVIWAIAALSAVFIRFIGTIDLRIYFASLLSIAVLTQFSYRFRLASTITERKYLLTLVGVVLASIALIAGTGGAFGPFIYLSYLSIFAGAVIIRPLWAMAVASLYAGYVIAELVWHLQSHAPSGTDGHAARLLFLAGMLLLSGAYTAWTGQRRVAANESLQSANRKLAEALREAVRERERYERQAKDLKALNTDLVEMRSALMNVLEDVEESKRQIEAERRREVASFEALAEGVLAADKAGRIFLCNPTAASILGVSADAVIGEQIEGVLRLFREDDAVMQTHAFEEAFAGKTVALGERLRLTRPDGSTLPVSGNIAPYEDDGDGKFGVVAAFRDVTVEREIDRQKSDFISIASHQLRTPLSALRWFLDLLLGGDAGALKPKQKEYLTDMSASVTRMVKLVGDLLDISRIESGRTKPNPERIESKAFAEALAKEFEPIVKQQKVALTVEVDEGTGTFFADPSLAHQALSNVVSNALKYTQEGGSVRLIVRSEGGGTVFEVRDTGLGIPKSQQYRVFDKFFRGENVISRETVGSGLGLNLVKTIMDLSRGQVWFTSAEGKGTTFYLSFPNDGEALPTGSSGGTLSP